MESGTSTARLETGGGERFVPLRRQLGVTTFGMNQMVLDPGERGRIHRHREQEEVYLVLEGRLTLVVEGEEHTLGRGELVRVGPEVRRQLVNRHRERLVVLAVGGARDHVGRDGEAFASWETSEPAPPQEVEMPADLDPGELRD